MELKLIYPKQAGPHYERYGWQLVTGNPKQANLEDNIRYSSERGAKKPLYGHDVHRITDRGFHSYYPNVDIRINHDGAKALREDIADIQGEGSIGRFQLLHEKNGIVVKENSVTHFPKQGSDSTVRSIAILDKENGLYSVTRKNRAGEIAGGYEMSLKPKTDALAQGTAGKLQRLALKIGTDSNGCERPVLRKVAGFLFNIAKRVK